MLIGFTLHPVGAHADKLGDKQCSDALAVAHAVMKKHRISPRLAASFRRFRLSNCDLDTDFERDTAVDATAFGEFRLKLIALGTRQRG
jgi:hypothetical protein